MKDTPISRTEAEKLYRELKYAPWHPYSEFLELCVSPRWIDLCGVEGDHHWWLSARPAPRKEKS